MDMVDIVDYMMIAQGSLLAQQNRRSHIPNLTAAEPDRFFGEFSLRPRTFLTVSTLRKRIEWLATAKQLLKPSPSFALAGVPFAAIRMVCFLQAIGRLDLFSETADEKQRKEMVKLRALIFARSAHVCDRNGILPAGFADLASEAKAPTPST